MPDAADAPPAPAPARAAREGPGVFSNSIVNLLGLIAISAMGAVGGLVTANYLGPVGVGILAVTWGFIDFGRAVTSCTHIPSILQYHRGREDGVVFGTSLVVKIALSAVFIALMITLSPLLEATFNVPRSAILIASTVLVLSSFFEVGAARLEAHNRMVTSNLVLATGSLVGLSALLAIALAGKLTIFTSIYTTLTANVTMSVGAIWFAYRRLKLGWDWSLGVAMTKYGLRIVAASLLAQGLIWTDTLMVSFILGNDAAGVYQVVFQLTFVMVTASTAMGVALVPALSDLVGRGEDTSVGYQRGIVISGALSVTVALAYLAGGRLILGLYGPAFQEGYAPLLVLTLFGVAASVAVPASTMLTVHGHAGILTRLSLGQLLVNIPLNYVLIHRVGILGAAIATTTVFVIGTLVSWTLVRRYTGAAPFSRAALAEGRGFLVGALRRVWRR